MFKLVTVNELIDLLQSMKDQGCGDYELCFNNGNTIFSLEKDSKCTTENDINHDSKSIYFDNMELVAIGSIV